MDFMVLLSGSLPGFTPLSQDSVQQMPAFAYSVAALKSALLVRILQQFTGSRRKFVDLGGTLYWEVVLFLVLED